jgi:hypothetical protein
MMVSGSKVFLSNRWKTGILLLVVFFGILFSWKAITLSMTIDESATFLNFVWRDVKGIYLNGNGSANNQFLNTLFIKITTSIQTNDFFVRLPNILAGMAYVFFCLLLLKPFKSNKWLLMAGFFVLLGIPYLLDFFSLARGYGLAVGFMVMAVYFLLKYLSTHNIKYEWLAYVAAALAVLSNFTLLYFFIAMMAAQKVIWFLKYGFRNISGLVKSMLPAITVSVLLFLFIYYPLKVLIEGHQLYFGGTDGFQQDTLSGMAADFWYGFRIGGLNLDSVFIIGFYFLMALSAGLFIGNIARKETNRPLNVIFLITSLCILGHLLAFWLFDVKLPLHRTALYLFPLLALLLVHVLHELSMIINNKRLVPVYVFIIIIQVFQTISFYRPDDCKEWYFDVDTKNVLAFIEKKEEAKPVTIAAHWLYLPTMQYYEKTNRFPGLKIMEWTKEIDLQNNYDYYYVNNENRKQVETKYNFVRAFRVGYLYKLKNE